MARVIFKQTIFLPISPPQHIFAGITVTALCVAYNLLPAVLEVPPLPWNLPSWRAIAVSSGLGNAVHSSSSTLKVPQQPADGHDFTVLNCNWRLLNWILFILFIRILLTVLLNLLLFILIIEAQR